MVQLGWRWHPGDFALITDILEILLENFSGFLVHCSDGFFFGLRMKLGFRLRIHYDSLRCLRLLGRDGRVQIVLGAVELLLELRARLEQLRLRDLDDTRRPRPNLFLPPSKQECLILGRPPRCL